MPLLVHRPTGTSHSQTIQVYRHGCLWPSHVSRQSPPPLSIFLSPSLINVEQIHRPFAFINSRITISLGDDPSNVVGECQQEWHPWKRRYNLFLNRNGDFEQFARVDAGLLSWTFDAMDQDGRVLASIDRNWAGEHTSQFKGFGHGSRGGVGFGRELFTDTGHYALKFDAVGLEAADRSTSEEQDSSNSNTRDIVVHQGITLDQRAVLLATAVTCDIDYFSRHSGHGG